MYSSCQRKLLLIVLSLLCSAHAAESKTLKDIEIPEHFTDNATQQTLLLNGAGIRTKFFVSVYIGALYLPQKQTEVPVILQTNQPRRVLIYCLHAEISKQKLTDAWNEGFRNNTSETQLAALQDSIALFNQLFPALHKGDLVYLDYSPSTGTTLTVNHKVLGTIPGQDFNSALLKIWLGEYPADTDLKAAMLGQE